MGSRRTSGGSRHLRFKLLPRKKGRKTDRYEIWNAQFNELIGHVFWRGGWRQYVWRMVPDVDTSRSCGKEIIDFINKLMDERKKK